MVNLKKRLTAPHWISTYLILILLISGCNDKYGRIIEPVNDRFEITEAHSELSDLANDSDLPMMYVSEGKIGVSKVEATLEEADAV